MNKKRIYCPQCSGRISEKPEGDRPRDYCESCDLFFYDNPLPVASTIITSDRTVLLVKRKNKPHKGKWCLPSGFAESGESIESAALRELEEETGVKGRIIDFVSADSIYSIFYGDLLFLTFEAEHIAGEIAAGDDAIDVKFFPLDKLPELAFKSNIKAIEIFILGKQEYWAIIDSFTRSITGKAKKVIESGREGTTGKEDESMKTDFLSDKLIRIIEKNAEVIANRWLEDVNTNKSTPTYARFDPQTSFGRNKRVLKQFGSWLGGHYSSDDISAFYTDLGRARKLEGFALSEVISAISLTRKHIWEFALSQQMWTKTIDIYMSLELERRMMLFFDKATYHVVIGYQEAS